MRVTAQLVDVATGFHLWGGRYDRPFSDTLAMQEDLASRIGETLIVKLDEAEQERLAVGGGSGLGEFLWSGLEGLARLADGAVGMTLVLFRWILAPTQRREACDHGHGDGEVRSLCLDMP